MASSPWGRRGVLGWWRSRASRDSGRVVRPQRRRDSLPASWSSSCVRASGGLAAAGFGLCLPAGGMCSVTGFLRRKAALQGIHQVNHLARLCLRMPFGQGLVAQLRLDELAESRFEVVLERGSVEGLAIGLDQLLRHRKLSLIDDGLLEIAIVGCWITQLFFIAQQVHVEPGGICVRRGCDGDKMLAPAEGDLGQTNALTLA